MTTIRLAVGKSRIPTIIEMPPRICVDSFSFDESTHCGKKLNVETKKNDKGNRVSD